jgi:GMP synthase (glutamine-hydrolysing)
MKKVLYIFHQKTSVAGDVGKKFENRGFSADIIRPPLGDILPNNLSSYSAIVIFGGPMSVNDDEKFIRDEIKWMKKVIDSKIPFLGICLGAQILAKYLGCDVVKNKKNLSEIGFFEIEPIGEGDQIFKSQNVFYQFHTEGFELPDGCQLLARGYVFQNQAFRYQNCYALQFHPEVNFFVHLRWLFLVLTKKPKILFHKGSQNLFYQLYLRTKYNKSISLWLDSFFDNYLLAQK